MGAGDQDGGGEGGRDGERCLRARGTVVCRAAAKVAARVALRAASACARGRSCVASCVRFDVQLEACERLGSGMVIRVIGGVLSQFVVFRVFTIATRRLVIGL